MDSTYHGCQKVRNAIIGENSQLIGVVKGDVNGAFVTAIVGLHCSFEDNEDE